MKIFQTIYKSKIQNLKIVNKNSIDKNDLTNKIGGPNAKKYEFAVIL